MSPLLRDIWFYIGPGREERERDSVCVWWAHEQEKDFEWSQMSLLLTFT